jgi:hypothetical protein
VTKDMDIVFVKDSNGFNIVDEIEATGNTVLLAAHPNYLIESDRGGHARGELSLGMFENGISFAILDVDNNRCRFAYFADAKRDRTAIFSAETGPMRGTKTFVPNYWSNWMNE